MVEKSEKSEIKKSGVKVIEKGGNLVWLTKKSKET